MKKNYIQTLNPKTNKYVLIKKECRLNGAPCIVKRHPKRNTPYKDVRIVK